MKAYHEIHGKQLLKTHYDKVPPQNEYKDSLKFVHIYMLFRAYQFNLWGDHIVIK
jgi:hypothetical protein